MRIKINHTRLILSTFFEIQFDRAHLILGAFNLAML